MAFRRLYSLLLLVLAIRFSVEECNTTLHEDKLQQAICVCDSGDTFNGWIYSCINRFTFTQLFALDYVVDSFVTFRCGDMEPYTPALLKQLDLSKIHTFVFKSCPLPNTSYWEILSEYSVEQIKVEMKKDDRPFTADMFRNLSDTLTSLILSHNEIKEIPESLFVNFTQLKFLSLSDNELSTLPENLFLDLSQLLVLEITNNNLEKLPANIFRNLFQLEKLYLYKNQLKGLPEGLFESLVNLKVLDLADNHLTSLSSHVFLGLSQLIHVRLRANFLQIIPKSLFHYSPNLKEIDLSLNRFAEPFPDKLLHNLNHLENVSFHECNLTQIHQDFFSRCPNITNLNLENNALQALPEGIFDKNTMLKELNLNFNFIKSIPSNLFPNQKYLQKLFLFRNNISSLPDGFFKHARNINMLVLGRNRLKSFGQGIFRDLPNIESVDLSNNNLTHFGLDFNEYIKDIDLSYNNFGEMPSINWLQHLKIEILNLEYNNLTTLSIPVLYSTNKRNPSLKFGHNNISKVSVTEIILNDGHIMDLPSKDYENYVESTISLYPNPFSCDCKLYSFYDYLQRSNEAHKRSVRFAMIQNLTCRQPKELAGNPIMMLMPHQFTCELTSGCVSPCKCYTRAQDNARIANCSNHRLRDLPISVPKNTGILYFQNNNLTDMESFNKPTWASLTGLFLDNNQITSLDAWDIPVGLKNLTLRGNQIKRISPSLLEFASNASEFQIALSENPWKCDCETVDFKQWLTENYQVVRDVTSVMCANQLELNGTMARMPIVTITGDVMCPISDWPYKAQLISVTTICVVLALLLFIVSVLYYRNKQTVIAYVYIHMHNFFVCFFTEDDIDEDKVFDAFVSYSGTDSDVAHLLIQELENKDPYFKLCIHERNWLPGNLISWNIINSVQNSRRTILVISKEFLESMWFKIEFRAAYYQMLEDKRDRLIVIIKGDLPPKETLDTDLQFLLATKTYLVWEEKWFWEKLKYAMPHKKQRMLRNDVMALKDRPASDKVKSVENQIAILSSNGYNKTSGKVQEVVQNGTNRALNLVNKENFGRI